MASYFTISTDLSLIHPDLQSSVNLATVAAQVEAEIIARYKVYVGNDYYPRPRDVVVSASNYAVMLRGYATDADSANSEFKDAFKRTIATVINHRLRSLQTGMEEGVTSWSEGARSRTYATPQRASYPPSWRALLIPFELQSAYAW